MKAGPVFFSTGVVFDMFIYHACLSACCYISDMKSLSSGLLLIISRI